MIFIELTTSLRDGISIQKVAQMSKTDSRLIPDPCYVKREGLHHKQAGCFFGKKNREKVRERRSDDPVEPKPYASVIF